MTSAKKLDEKTFLILTVLVTTFGYFVDVYDIWVFVTTRMASLKDIGVAPEKMMDTGILLLNLQMGGMLLGGLFFGVLGDKLGRTRVMFISILTYSLATLGNAFVQNVESFAVLRFLSGFGLAGELGLGCTLISEVLSKEKRGLGVGIMVSFGVTGALAAGFAAQHMAWRDCYLLGGGMGLLLLLFRMRVLESSMFKAMQPGHARGDLRMLFATRERFGRFLCCILLGMPVWYLSGIVIAFAPEILPAMGLMAVPAAVLLIYANGALAIGDALSTWGSHLLKSRRLAYLLFVGLSLAGFLALLYWPRPLDETGIIALYIVMGIGNGIWVLMAIMAAESFGTNLRATVATSVPNFARGSVVLMTGTLSLLKQHLPLLDSVIIVGVFAFALPLLALWRLPETYGKDLDYLEK
jgi:putative MFS transporter